MKKTVRLVDIAVKAGVSRVAVGKVLLGSGSDRVKVSEDTALRIREIANELGYSPNRAAQQLGGKPSRLIGVATYLGAPSVELDRLVALEREAYKRNYQVTIRALGNPGDPEEMMTCLQGFESQGVDGVIFLTGEPCACTDEALARFNVCLYSGCPEILGSLPGMVINIEEGIRLSTEHLLASGRRRLALAFVGDNPYDMIRRDTLRAAIESTNQAMFLEWKPETPAGKMRKLTPEAADTIVKELVVEQSADAIIATNDYWAAALLQALSRAHIAVPDDVAVMGYSNLELSEFTEPRLSTVEEHNDQIAEAFLDLFSECRHSEESLHRSVKPTLVLRESA